MENAAEAGQSTSTAPDLRSRVISFFAIGEVGVIAALILIVAFF